MITVAVFSTPENLLYPNTAERMLKIYIINCPYYKDTLKPGVYEEKSLIIIPKYQT